eukprot:CAMPEP_0170566094 /NCGR_PEP_ID=MMETSP0211-20121228/79620_1 /TAXON_ID=311385 /ORGANISM="Pseudokeronopsis sp., Strain OXSARD2" /LENGTH=230 /DNA_ID=CAMNT_0010887171 /DNA_START=505 /DNA_END=1194 /DNA_ORIENTATION=+
MQLARDHIPQTIPEASSPDYVIYYFLLESLLDLFILLVLSIFQEIFNFSILFFPLGDLLVGVFDGVELLDDGGVEQFLEVRGDKDLSHDKKCREEASEVREIVHEGVDASEVFLLPLGVADGVGEEAGALGVGKGADVLGDHRQVLQKAHHPRPHKREQALAQPRLRVHQIQLCEDLLVAVEDVEVGVVEVALDGVVEVGVVEVLVHEHDLEGRLDEVLLLLLLRRAHHQ